MSIKRNTQQTERIYVNPAAAEGVPQNVFVVNDDGEGRHYFDTVNEAKEETGHTKVIYLLEEAADN